MTTDSAVEVLDPEQLRGDFPILDTVLHGKRPLVYFDNAATTQRPRAVIDAIVEMYEKYYSNVHRGIHWLSERSTERYEAARAKVAGFIGAAHCEEVIFTSGTTMSINAVARSWGDENILQGDEILLSTMEHHSNLVPWHQLAERRGARLRHIPITDDGLLILEEFRRLLSERTKLVAVTGVSNVLGTVNPLEEIAAAAHDAGALLLVDAAQQVPHLPVDVKQLGADFLAFSGHKMLGPSGIGVLYGRRELLDDMPPFLGGGSMISDVQPDHFRPAKLPAKFEAGTPPIVPAVAMTAAIDYLEKVGLGAIHEHEMRLTRYAHAVLDQLGGVTVYGPPPQHKAGIVSFTLDDVHPQDAALLLDRHGVAVRAGHHCTQPLHERLGVSATLRASFYLYNTREEIDQLAEAIVQARKKLA